VDHSVQLSGLRLGSAIIFLLPSWKLSCHFPLWRGGGSVKYVCCWSSPALFYFWVQVPRNSWPYFTVSTFIQPKFGRAISCIRYPRNKAAQFDFHPLYWIIYVLLYEICIATYIHYMCLTSLSLGSLQSNPILCLTAAKFKPLIFPVALLLRKSWILNRVAGERNWAGW
jgi:hypothetical protein